MRLYSRADATAIDDPEYGHIDAESDGTFKVPDDMADRLLRFHHRGEPLWENETQRSKRLKTEDLDRRRDPAALLDAVQQILMAAQIAQAAQAAPAAAAPDAVGPETDDETDGDSETTDADPGADAPAPKQTRRRAAKPAAE